MKHRLLLLVMALLPIIASAYEAKIDGLDYNFDYDAMTATVTYKSYDFNDYPYPYNKDWNITIANIPASVVYNGVTYNVTSIGKCAFYGCRCLTSVTIPNSVTVIGGSAFQYCSGLTSIEIPNSVTDIGGGAFYNCI